MIFLSLFLGGCPETKSEGDSLKTDSFQEPQGGCE